MSFALVQLLVPLFLTDLIDIQLRAVHVALGLSLAILVFSKRVGKITPFEMLMIIIVLLANINILGDAYDIYITPGASDSWDIALGIAIFMIILIVARNSMGWPIPTMVLLFLAYIFLG